MSQVLLWAAGQLARTVAVAPARQRDRVVAWMLVVRIRLALWLMPFRRFRAWAEGQCQIAEAVAERDPLAAARIAGRVRSVSRLVPDATCLVQAAAARILLARAGIASTLRLGVRRGSRGELLAHAWVECNGIVIIGGIESPGTYSTLT